LFFPARIKAFVPRKKTKEERIFRPQDLAVSQPFLQIDTVFGGRYRASFHGTKRNEEGIEDF
jgi:hypothetical protein